jgi:uncharacterized protein (TIGR00299 family) protein
MRILYIECNMGAAGDMLGAALLELVPDREAMLNRLNSLGIPGVRFAAEPMVKQGITGTHLRVTVHDEEEESRDVTGHDHAHDHEHHHHHDHDHEHHHHHEHEHSLDHGHTHVHRGPGEIAGIVDALDLPEKVRQDVKGVYRLIADAESAVHGVPVEEIHFHEVGALDAVADVTAVCLLMDELRPDKVVVSPITTGFGQVRSAHGILPVPAPATARLLEGMPVTGGNQEGELCTPTGAALLRHFAGSFGRMPVMRVSRLGCGMGKKDFPAANCLRAFLGESAEEGEDTVLELRCELDDMTPEALGYAQERLLEGGALDVYTTAIGMKKNRPGILLTCLCREEKREEVLRLMFRHTTTLGIRESLCRRSVLQRRQETVETEQGTIRIKKSSGWGVSRDKPEYEDLAGIARRADIPLEEAKKLIR